MTATRATKTNKAKQQRAAFLLALEGDAALGATPDERRAMGRRMQGIALAGNVAGALAALWAAFWPSPYVWSILAAAAMPVLAIALQRWGRRFFAFGQAPDGRFALIVMYAAPAAVLAIRAASDIALIDWPMLLPVVAVVAAACGALVAALCPDVRNLAGIGLLALTCALYAYGVIAQADVRLDDSQPTIYQATIMERLVSTGRGHAHTFVLSDWGPDDDKMSGSFGVKPDLFDRFQEGDTICAFVKPGFLRLTWYALDGCPAGQAQ
ncbi:hypothetical protein [Methylocapsa sp. S129]|uniref:hypothetical protein n=1 Tax=Methylocapsa sp. S129 TaxID=1641869 RepID=UPI00131CA917|nr:hypothetical protein [Methylocapsa sp. S129]